MDDFQGLTAAVTGGASGIGAATVSLLRAGGAKVIVLDIAEPSDGARKDDQIAMRCDITDDSDLSAAVDEIGASEGKLDVLVNNAGIGASGDVTANDREEWRRILEVNVVSTARVTAAMMPLLRRSPSASIVNVSSIVANVGVRNRVAYSASKGAISAMTLAMAADLVSENVRVNAVAPGTADTPWVGRLIDAARQPEAEAASLRARQPMGRLVTADEVAFAICYLASPRAGCTTGTVLTVDGGMGSLRV